jgi:hypothetical protein
VEQRHNKRPILIYLFPSNSCSKSRSLESLLRYANSSSNSNNISWSDYSNNKSCSNNRPLESLLSCSGYTTVSPLHSLPQRRTPRSDNIAGAPPDVRPFNLFTVSQPTMRCETSIAGFVPTLNRHGRLAERDCTDYRSFSLYERGCHSELIL